MTDIQPRKPSGAPVGGQFDRKQGSAPASTLGRSCAPTFDQAWFADTFPAETARTRECGFNPVEVIRTPSGKSLVTYRMDGPVGDVDVVVEVFNSGCLPEARVVAASFDGPPHWDEPISSGWYPSAVDQLAGSRGYTGDPFAVEEAVVEMAAAVDAWHLAGSPA